jgi:hypothetical protein
MMIRQGGVLSMKRKQLKPMARNPATKQTRNTPTLIRTVTFRCSSYQGNELIHVHAGRVHDLRSGKHGQARH